MLQKEEPNEPWGLSVMSPGWNSGTGKEHYMLSKEIWKNFELLL